MQIDLILIAGAIVVIYAAIANRLFAFAAPSRDDFRAIAFDLIRDPRVSPEQRRQLAILVSGIDRAHTAWLLVASLPFIVTDAALKKRRGAPLGASFPYELRDKWRRATRLFSVCTLCNSPAALILFGLGIASASFVFSGAWLAEKALGRAAEKLDADGVTNRCPPTHPA